MHRRLCKQVNCSCWQVTGGQSGGSSLPSRQSGEKSHFHFSGMHFWPSAHWKTSGSLQSKLTSSLWPCTMAKHNSSNMNLIIMTSWTGATFLQTEEKLDASDSRRPSRPSFRPRRRRRFMLCGWQLFEPLRLKNFFFLGFLRSNFPMTISLVWIINGLPLKKQQDSSSSHLSEFFWLLFYGLCCYAGLVFEINTLFFHYFFPSNRSSYLFVDIFLTHAILTSFFCQMNLAE